MSTSLTRAQSSGPILYGYGYGVLEGPQLQMYVGAMFVKDDKTRHKAPNEHIFNKGAIKRDQLPDAWRRFMDTPGDQGGFDPVRHGC